MIATLTTPTGGVVSLRLREAVYTPKDPGDPRGSDSLHVTFDELDVNGAATRTRDHWITGDAVVQTFADAVAAASSDARPLARTAADLYGGASQVTP